MIRALLVPVAAAGLAAQSPYNVDFGDNQVALTSVDGVPGLLVWNLTPRSSQSAPHRLVAMRRPLPGLLPIRLHVRELAFLEPEACAWGRNVVFSGTGQTDWSGTVGAQGVAHHFRVDRTLEWTDPGNGQDEIAAGVLAYDPAGGPMTGC